MGGGDIKMMAMVGAFLGWQGVLLTIFLGALLGSLIFVPLYARVTARFGTRAVAVGTLVFFSLNVVLFWYAFRRYAGAALQPWSFGWLLPAIF